MRRLAGLLLPVALLAALALPLGASADTLDPKICPTSGPRVCFIDETHTPRVTVPVAGTAERIYAHFTARVKNEDTSTATHFTITAAPDAAFTLVSLSASTVGARTASCTGLVCSFGNLPAGGIADVDLVVQVVPGAAIAQARNTFALSLAEGTNDNPSNGGKGDAAPLSQPVQLLAHDGAAVYSYLPAGAVSTLTTDRAGKPFGVASSTDPEVGTTRIPALSQATPVSLSLVGDSEAGATCPGSCAMQQHWMQASVPGLRSGSLQTTTRVDSTLVSTVRGLTASSAVVYYRPDAAASTLTQVLPRCTFTKSGTTPSTLGCFTATKERDGDLTVVVYEDHNGLIRF